MPRHPISPLSSLVFLVTVVHCRAFDHADRFSLWLSPDALWFPPLIEMLIAMSIVYMALENIVGSNMQRRWMITFVFGLVHGFGFSFALRETLQFAGPHLLTALLAFNVGVELGQLRWSSCWCRRSLCVQARAGAHRHDHPVRVGRTYCLALDDRARGSAAAVSLAAVRRRVLREYDALAHVDPRSCLRADTDQCGVTSDALAAGGQAFRSTTYSVSDR